MDQDKVKNLEFIQAVKARMNLQLDTDLHTQMLPHRKFSKL
jgi:hypothetical protein